MRKTLLATASAALLLTTATACGGSDTAVSKPKRPAATPTATATPASTPTASPTTTSSGAKITPFGDRMFTVQGGQASDACPGGVEKSYVLGEDLLGVICK